MIEASRFAASADYDVPGRSLLDAVSLVPLEPFPRERVFLTSRTRTPFVCPDASRCRASPVYSRAHKPVSPPLLAP